MPDKVFIRALQVEAKIGVFDWEKKIFQTLVIDLTLAQNNKKAASNDDINDALNYAAISESVSDYCRASSFNLIETLAERLSELLFENFEIDSLELTLSKPDAVAQAETVGVTIIRERSS